MLTRENTMAEICLIYAQSNQNVIGKDNKIPWNIPEDMFYFKNKTEGHTVVMGRETWNSLPEKFKPLPNRQNVVVTTDDNLALPQHVQKVTDFNKYLREKINNKSDEKIFLIGGSRTLEAGMRYASRIYLTEVFANIVGDTYAPTIDNNCFTALHVNAIIKCLTSGHFYRHSTYVKKTIIYDNPEHYAN